MSGNLSHDSLLHHIRDVRDFTERDAWQVARFFQAIGLPIPKEKEYYVTNDENALVFLTIFGCTVRIVQKGYPMPRHPLILQPIASRYTDNLRIDINPGIELGCTEDDAYSVRDLLKKDGIILGDPHGGNVGRIPMTNKIVVIDPEQIENQRQEQSIVGRIWESIKSRHFESKDIFSGTPQDVLYAPLRNTFNAAWKSGSMFVNSEKMEQFWETAKNMKEQGMLVSAWEEADYNGTTESSRNFMKVLTNSKSSLLACAA